MQVKLDRQPYVLTKYSDGNYYLIATKDEQSQFPRMVRLENGYPKKFGIPLSNMTPGEIVRLKKA